MKRIVTLGAFVIILALAMLFLFTDARPDTGFLSGFRFDRRPSSRLIPAGFNTLMPSLP